MSRARAEEILAKMENNPDGDFTQSDYEKLYRGFGFTKRNGSNHTIYTYKKYGLRATVARHNLYDIYAVNAVKIIKRLKEELSKEALLNQQGGTSNVSTEIQEDTKSKRNNSSRRGKRKKKTR